jgi:hypothetical protein
MSLEIENARLTREHFELMEDLRSRSADDLRREGWTVAVHNDYVLDGEPMTFWLFTHPPSGRFIKGEGRTDAEALAHVRLALLKLTVGTSKTVPADGSLPAVDGYIVFGAKGAPGAALALLTRLFIRQWPQALVRDITGKFYTSFEDIPFRTLSDLFLYRNHIADASWRQFGSIPANRNVSMHLVVSRDGGEITMYIDDAAEPDIASLVTEASRTLPRVR